MPYPTPAAIQPAWVLTETLFMSHRCSMRACTSQPRELEHFSDAIPDVVYDNTPKSQRQSNRRNEESKK